MEDLDLKKKNMKQNRNIYVERLYQEWVRHGKIVIAVDYDSTIRPWSTIDNKEDIDRAINVIKDSQQVGAYVVVFTESDESREIEIREYCESIGIRVDSVNKPIILPYGGQGKIFYNIQLCDRSGFKEATEILSEAMYLTRAWKHGERTNYPGALG